MITPPASSLDPGHYDAPTQSVSTSHKRSRFPWLVVAGGLSLFALGWFAGSWRAHNSDNPPLVSINGDIVRQQELDHRLEIANGKAMLKQMLNEQYQLQLAKQQNVLPTDGDIESKYVEASKQPDFEKKLAASLQTPDDIKHGLRVSLAQQAVIGKGVSVTDEDVLRFYQVQSDPHNPQARYYQPETVTIAVIVSDKETDIAQALHLLASGLSFASVAQKISKDQSKTNNGLLPPIRRGQMDGKKFPGLEKTVFSLQPGQQIERLRVAGAWWIVRCVGHTAEKRTAFDQVKEECRTGAMLAKGLQANGQALQTQSQAFAKEAQITVYNPAYSDVVPGK